MWYILIKRYSIPINRNRSYRSSSSGSRFRIYLYLRDPVLHFRYISSVIVGVSNNIIVIIL